MIFLSYCHVQKKIVHKLADRLLRENHRVWIDKDNISVGDKLTEEIENGIKDSSLIVCFLSKDYIESNMCRLEFFFAHKRNKKCIYVLMERIDKNETNGINPYLEGESVRLDAFKNFTENDDEGNSNFIYNKLRPVFSKANKNEGIDEYRALENEVFGLKRDYCFFGREKLFQLLDENNNFRLIILHGLPGVGKSSSIVEYVYRMCEKKKISRVYWIDADSVDQIKEKFYFHGSKLGNNLNRDEAINRFIRSVRDCDDVILVFDNTENLDDIQQVIDIHLHKFRVLISTRTEKKMQNALIYELKPWSLDEAKEYLKKRVNHLNDNVIDEILTKINSSSQCLPYQVTTIAGVLSENPDLDLDSIFRMGQFNDFFINVLRKLSEENRDAFNVLKFIVNLDQDYISVEFFKVYFKNGSFMSGLRTLKNQNFCKYLNSNTPEFGICFHRLLEKDLRSSLNDLVSEKTRQKVLDKTVCALSELFPQTLINPDDTWRVTNAHYRHVKKLYENRQLNKLNLQTCNLLRNAACYHNNVTLNFTIGLKYSLDALKLSDHVCQEDHPKLAKALFIVGISYGRIGDTYKALKYSHYALDMRQRIFQGDHEDIAESYSEIAYFCDLLGKLKENFDFNSKALDMRQRLFDGDHNDLAKSLNNMAVSYERKNDYAKAYDFYTRALEMWQRLNNNADHLSISQALNNIAVIHEKSDRQELAHEYFTKSLEMRQRLFNGDHPQIAQSLYSISISFDKLKKHKKALEYALMAFEIRKRLYIGDHANLAQSYSNVAISYTRVGEHKTAYNFYRESVRMFEKLYKTENHADLAESYINFGYANENIGDYKLAIDYHSKALELAKKLFDDKHPFVINCQKNVERASKSGSLCSIS